MHCWRRFVTDDNERVLDRQYSRARAMGEAEFMGGKGHSTFSTWSDASNEKPEGGRSKTPMGAEARHPSFTRGSGDQANVVRDPATARGWPGSAAPSAEGLTKAEPPGGPAARAVRFPRSCDRFWIRWRSMARRRSARWLALVARLHRAVEPSVEQRVNASPTRAGRPPECRHVSRPLSRPSARPFSMPTRSAVAMNRNRRIEVIFSRDLLCSDPTARSLPEAAQVRGARAC